VAFMLDGRFEVSTTEVQVEVAFITTQSKALAKMNTSIARILPNLTLVYLLRW